MALSDDLKLRLVGKGQSVTDVAAKLGVGRSAVSNMLNGKAAISVAMAFKLEEVFAFDAAKILHRQLDEEIERARSK